jgi:rhombotail lipoprotein
LLVAGCASWVPQVASKQTGSIVDYLYPDAKEAPRLQPSVTYLRPPVRVGIAFVPGGAWNSGLPESEKTKLLERIKESFAKYPFIGSIEIIPTQYLRAKGGFTNLDQVARMFNVEVMALVSYDQVQFNDSNTLSLLYWTIVGAYVIHGDQYDIQTMVDTSVFDVSSRKLLFRAPGLSQVKGSAAMVGFNERARAARLDGYSKAVDELIPQLQAQLEGFKERIKTDKAYKVENKPGYSGGGDAGWLALVLIGLLGGATWRSARRSH